MQNNRNSFYWRNKISSTTEIRIHFLISLLFFYIILIWKYDVLERNTLTYSFFSSSSYKNVNEFNGTRKHFIWRIKRLKWQIFVRVGIQFHRTIPNALNGATEINWNRRVYFIVSTTSKFSHWKWIMFR